MGHGVTLLAAAAARRGAAYPAPPATETAPYGSLILCTIPTPDGSGATIHPSVVDMGTPFNGYRWWMANTPYPNQSEPLENPCIYGSNDRINWEVPAGLTNPIDPWPSEGLFPPQRRYNSDTVLAWDPDQGRFVCYYREFHDDGGGYTAIRARWSANGVAWSDELTMLETTWASGFSAVPSVVRRGPGDWVLLIMGRPSGMQINSGPTSLGPFTVEGYATGFGNQNHASVIRYRPDLWLCMGEAGLGYSTNGVAWTVDSSYIISGGAVLPNPYHRTLRPSTVPGFLDVWYSGARNDLPGKVGTAYTRIPVPAYLT